MHHVGQGDGRADRGKKIGAAIEAGRDQKPAIAQPPRRQGRWCRDAAFDQCGGDGGEIVEAVLLVEPRAAVVPARAELATAPDVGDDEGAATRDHAARSARKPGVSD